MGMDELQIPVEHKLLHSASLLDWTVLSEEATPALGNEDWVVRMELQVDESVIYASAHGALFAIGVLSFHDGRPRGISGQWFEDEDQFSISDFLEHLRFERGKLNLSLDYIRGRCLKTEVEISSNGKISLKTVNRGKAALGWIAKLQGKKLVKSVG